MKTPLYIITAAILSACSPDYRELNNQVVCAASTKKAYMVRHNVGDTSIVYPAPQFQELCK